MKQTLNLKVSQQLSLTPQLKQSLRLLQLSTVDLEQEIQNALDTNPLLERVETTNQTTQQAADNVAPQAPQEVAEAVDPGFEIDRSDNLAPEQQLHENWLEVFESRRSSARSPNIEPGASSEEFTRNICQRETLFEHLMWQIQMTSLSQQDKLIAETLLHCLDHDGYLTLELDEVCGFFSPDQAIEEDQIHAVLSLIKTLDPIGVGAKNLPERLLIMLNRMPQELPGLADAKIIVNEHLSSLAAHKFSELRRHLSIDKEALTTSVNLITQLNPRIANRFTDDQQEHIIPDVIVKKINGLWQAQLNPDNQCKLRTNAAYADLLKSDIDKQGSDYIQEKLLQAKIFIKGIMSRYDTLLLVAQAIVDRQYAFFEHGQEQMQAMVLQDIAEQLEMHESTISRATAGKYLLSARGVLELKYFFSSALTSTSGDGTSSTAVRYLIKNMIDNERKAKPLSDNKISEELGSLGHVVARRTVAKYRESMHISASGLRKSIC